MIFTQPSVGARWDVLFLAIMNSGTLTSECRCLFHRLRCISHSGIPGPCGLSVRVSTGKHGNTGRWIWELAAGVWNTFTLSVVMKYTDKSNIKDNRFVLAHSLRVHLIMTGKSRQQEFEVAAHMASRQKVVNSWVHAVLSSLYPFTQSQIHLHSLRS